jgi:hypothetical protein
VQRAGKILLLLLSLLLLLLLLLLVPLPLTLITQRSNAWDLFSGAQPRPRLSIDACRPGLEPAGDAAARAQWRVSCAAAAALMLPALPAGFSGSEGACLCANEDGPAIVNSGLQAYDLMARVRHCHTSHNT